MTPGSLALMVWVLWCFEGLKEKDYWMNEWMKELLDLNLESLLKYKYYYKGDCRTAPDTLGLVIINVFVVIKTEEN